MHDIAKQVVAVFRADIHNLDQIPSEDIEDVPHVWEGKTTGDESIRVSVCLGVLSLHIQRSDGEKEIARVNLGRLAEINTRAERNINRLRRSMSSLRPLTRSEENRCWLEAASSPERRFFESHKITPAAFGGIWQTLKALRRFMEAAA
ncbi:MAG: hypothetical protein WC003_17165 [Terrimicrobiaceae bacterium]